MLPSALSTDSLPVPAPPEPRGLARPFSAGHGNTDTSLAVGVDCAAVGRELNLRGHRAVVSTFRFGHDVAGVIKPFRAQRSPARIFTCQLNFEFWLHRLFAERNFIKKSSTACIAEDLDENFPGLSWPGPVPVRKKVQHGVRRPTTIG